MRGNSLFSQIFGGFLISIILFTVILLIFYKIGLSGAIDRWSEHSLTEVKEIARIIILGEDDVDNLVSSEDEPIFIYNMNKELIFTNRGKNSKIRNPEDFVPVYTNKEVIGYLYTSQVHFMDIKANKQFTYAITKAIIYALLISTVLVVILSLIITGKISRPAKNIANSLEILSQGEKGHTIEPTGALEIRQITQSLNLLSQKLAREGELRTQWARDIAHDLRTPVAALKAQFEGMSYGALDINLSRINQNLKEVFRMEVLVEDLSELMKLEEPELKLYLDSINTDDFVNEIVSRGTKEATEKNIKITIDNNVPDFVADEMLLHRAVSNIWSNAIRHVNESGEISILTKDVGKSLQLVISNSGDVIPIDELEKIFDRLFRGEVARNSQGSGLGLTITKRIIELHGGSINVTSNSNTGTSFIINIPEK